MTCFRERGRPGLRLAKAILRSFVQRRLGPGSDLKSLYFKNEGANPTWSFKDRYVAVTLNLAREFGFRRVVVSSTGNLGLSTAAYAAAGGMQCVLLTPPGTSPTILAQAQMHGARVVADDMGRSPGSSYSSIWRGRRTGFRLGCSCRGQSTIHLASKGTRLSLTRRSTRSAKPRRLCCSPARGEMGCTGHGRGFARPSRWGWINERPAMVACQPVGANSLQMSISSGATAPVELPPITSVAFSEMEAVADRQALAAIRASQGSALSATDAEILSAQRELATEGIFVEASSALPVACLERLKAEKRVDIRRPVVCVLTAAGVQWSDRLTLDREALIEIPPDPAVLHRHLSTNSGSEELTPCATVRSPSSSNRHGASRCRRSWLIKFCV